MEFTLKYAGRKDEKKINIKTLGGLKRLQKRLISEEIKLFNYTSKYEKVRTIKQLRNHTSFSYELIVDFANMEITFYDYWIE